MPGKCISELNVLPDVRADDRLIISRHGEDWQSAAVNVSSLMKVGFLTSRWVLHRDTGKWHRFGAYTDDDGIVKLYVEQNGYDSPTDDIPDGSVTLSFYPNEPAEPVTFSFYPNEPVTFSFYPNEPVTFSFYPNEPDEIVVETVPAGNPVYSMVVELNDGQNMWFYGE